MTVMTDIDPAAILAIYDDHMGGDLKVANAARVSFAARSKLDENGNLKPGDAKLIRFLARGMTTNDFDGLVDEIGDRGWMMMEPDSAASSAAQGDHIVEILNKWRGTPLHKSPFNHVFASFWCQAPIFVARQCVKHEYMPYNEMSGRYIEFQPHFYMPSEIRQKVEDKKQGSGPEVEPHIALAAREKFLDSHMEAYGHYSDLMSMGVCEEQARGVLPLNTMTQWIWSGSLGAIAKMCQLRTAPDAQYETQILARQISDKMADLYPVSWDALMTYGVGE